MNILEVLINNPQSSDDLVREVRRKISRFKDNYEIGKRINLIRFYVISNHERVYYSPTDAIARMLKNYLRPKDIRYEHVDITIIGNYKARKHDIFYLGKEAGEEYYINSFISSVDYPGHFPTDYYAWGRDKDPHKYYDLEFILQCFRLVDKDMEIIRERLIKVI